MKSDPTVWIASGIEVNSDIFRFEKPDEPARRTGRLAASLNFLLTHITLSHYQRIE